MAIEYVWPSQIHSALSNVDRNGFGRHQIQLPPLDDKQNGFNRYHQMATKTILAIIKFNHHLWMEIEKKEYDKPPSACFGCP